MRIWVGDTCDKRGFVDYLADTYAKKPIAVCETRNVYNTVIRNFTVANDPNSNKFTSAVGTIRGIVASFLRSMPHEIIIFDDWFTDADVGDIDYFVSHTEADIDAICRVADPDADGMKKRQRGIEQLAKLKTQAPDKLILLDYHERVRDLFDVVEEGDMGVQLQLKTALIAQRHYSPKDLKSERLDVARLLGGTYGERRDREAAAAREQQPQVPQGAAGARGIVLRTAGDRNPKHVQDGARGRKRQPDELPDPDHPRLPAGPTLP